MYLLKAIRSPTVKKNSLTVSSFSSSIENRLENASSRKQPSCFYEIQITLTQRNLLCDGG